MNTFRAAGIATEIPAPWQDRLFWLALAAGPLAWTALSAWTLPTFTTEQLYSRPAAALLAIAVYPIVEEWLFRGRIQGALAHYPFGHSRWLGISGANLATSLLFSALHAVNHPPLWAAGVLLPSLLFGLFRDRYGRIGPSILLHAVYNAGYFILWPPA